MSDITADDLDTVSHWFFAIGGLQTARDVLELAPAIRLQRLKTFPTRTELTSHLDNPLVAGLMQHYGKDVVQHELVIDAELTDDPQFIPRLASALLAGLRIRTEAEIFCPAVCDRSWADLREAPPNSCKAFRIEPAMYSHEFEETAVITEEDITWVTNHLEKLHELTDDQRFSTALDALCTYLHAANYRMMAAQLWAGIEAIFRVRFEITFQLSLQAALLLEKRGPKCRDIYKEIIKLYQDRSKAVHGGKISDDKLQEHVALTRALLASLLAKIIERGIMPSATDLDELTVMPQEEEKEEDLGQSDL